MATAAAETNDLVMSQEEIQSELNDDTQSEEVPEESVPEDESDDRSPWEDGDEDEATGTEDEESQAKKPATSVRTVKADGKTYQVDTKDVAKLDRLLSLGLSAPRVYSELAKVKKEVATHKAAADKGTKYQQMWANLEKAKLEGHDSLYEKIFGKSFKQVLEEHKAYEAASDDEKKLIDAQRRADAIAAKVKAAEDRAAEIEKQAEEKSNQAEIREYKSRLTTSFRKYEFSSKVEDEVKAEKLNRMLWRNVLANLKAEYGDKDDIPQDVIDREFKDASELLGGTIQEQAKREVKKITEEKKKTSKAQAQAAASRNYSSADAEKISKESDPLKIFDKMFGKRRR